MDHIERVAAQDYLPTGQDILRAEISMPSTSQTNLRIGLGSRELRLLNVNDQGLDMSSWIQALDAVFIEAIFYVVTLTGAGVSAAKQGLGCRTNNFDRRTKWRTP
jgi:hypothetical protein